MTFIYFIQAGDSGPVKVGKADNVEKRLRHHQCAHYEELHVLAAVAGQASDERAFHNVLRDRLRGEWFRPTPQLLQVVEYLNEGRGIEYALRYLKLNYELISGARHLDGIAGTKQRYRRLRLDPTKSLEFRNLCSEILLNTERQFADAGPMARRFYTRLQVKRAARAGGKLRAVAA